ncbi:hypothetical protein [Candidatus Nanohalobium constans]|uniref:Uncharacterized protein n=1 Tax=Candidatus Nanohalobium constans TaxID=2565781 RepID=A0A5Q0UG86_9ARCH|nr:hypothetical protein [Candidatus Nanohalobium constans]QGA80617.1 hypothetical protein LC1Nh_0730 [Candidatus Nanohalobium constans]
MGVTEEHSRRAERYATLIGGYVLGSMRRRLRDNGFFNYVAIDPEDVSESFDVSQAVVSHALSHLEEDKDYLKRTSEAFGIHVDNFDYDESSSVPKEDQMYQYFFDCAHDLIRSGSAPTYEHEAYVLGFLAKNNGGEVSTSKAKDFIDKIFYTGELMQGLDFEEERLKNRVYTYDWVERRDGKIIFKEEELPSL